MLSGNLFGELLSFFSESFGIYYGILSYVIYI